MEGARDSEWAASATRWTPKIIAQPHFSGQSAKLQLEKKLQITVCHSNATTMPTRTTRRPHPHTAWSVLDTRAGHVERPTRREAQVRFPSIRVSRAVRLPVVVPSHGSRPPSPTHRSFHLSRQTQVPVPRQGASPGAAGARQRELPRAGTQARCVMSPCYSHAESHTRSILTARYPNVFEFT